MASLSYPVAAVFGCSKTWAAVKWQLLHTGMGQHVAVIGQSADGNEVCSLKPNGSAYCTLQGSNLILGFDNFMEYCEQLGVTFDLVLIDATCSSQHEEPAVGEFSHAAVVICTHTLALLDASTTAQGLRAQEAEQLTCAELVVLGGCGALSDAELLEVEQHLQTINEVPVSRVAGVPAVSDFLAPLQTFSSVGRSGDDRLADISDVRLASLMHT
mmetsp:Transcript_96188/g.271979  ORF Transcript_96188/g.271979 Transcript_96188/m.271979 type:complete len:214 (-) Transcript_96188:191-832(-)